MNLKRIPRQINDWKRNQFKWKKGCPEIKVMPSHQGVSYSVQVLNITGISGILE